MRLKKIAEVMKYAAEPIGIRPAKVLAKEILAIVESAGVDIEGV